MASTFPRHLNLQIAHEDHRIYHSVGLLVLNHDGTIMRKNWGSRGVESILITSDLSGKKVGKTLVFSPQLFKVFHFSYLLPFNFHLKGNLQTQHLTASAVGSGAKWKAELGPSILTEFPGGGREDFFFVLVYGIIQDCGYFRRNWDYMGDLKLVFSNTGACGIQVVSAV